MIARLRPLLLGLLLLVSIAAASRADDPPLVKLAEIGPWSSVSGLIEFRGRLWLANSVKYVNHNSADLYSYDPASGTLRYERHLFSQDVADPVVLGGRLYWPFEDARASAGVGEFAVTDGERWQWRVIPGGLAFHAQAFFAHDGVLYAGLSAWQALIARSDDGGVTWRVIYRHPTPEQRVSRITTFAALGGRVFAGVTAEAEVGPKLLVDDGAGFHPVQGWPERGATMALATFKRHVYGVDWSGGRDATWRTDGRTVQPVPPLEGVGVRAFAVFDGALFAAAGDQQMGTLWRSEDGESWRILQRFEGARPIALAVFKGGLYVGTDGPGEHGALWGPPPGTSAAAPPSPALGPLPDPPDPYELETDADTAKDLTALDRAASRIEGYDETFPRLFERLAQSRDPAIGTALAARLAGPFPDATFKIFGGHLTVTPRDIARWYMLRAIGLNGSGRVPPELIAEPIRSPANEAEKYFDTAPMAIWVAGELGQSDHDTIATLIGRLANSADPSWLDGDIVGALTALTGQRFGYDRAAWRTWWQGRRKP